MINFTHVIAFSVGGILMWCVLGHFHRKAMDSLTDTAKKCLDDVGKHAIQCMKQLANKMNKNDPTT